jgi:hypothetical protein
MALRLSAVMTVMQNATKQIKRRNVTNGKMPV